MISIKICHTLVMKRYGNKNGKDIKLEQKNKAKLTECVNQGYNVILVLNQQRLSYEEIMD